MKELEGKIFLVTGFGSRRGFGEATAIEILRQGGTPILSYYPPLAEREGDLDKALERLEAGLEGHEWKQIVATLLMLPCDLSRESEITGLCDELRERGIRLDGFLHSVANAPQSTYEEERTLLSLTTEEAHELTDLNALSFLWLCRNLVGFGELGSRILKEGAVGVSMTFCLGSRKRAGTYWRMGPPKSYLEGLAPYLAEEMGRYNVRLHLVNAGPVPTTAARAGVKRLDAFVEAAKDTVPSRSKTTPADVANEITYLFSPRARAAGLVRTVDYQLGDQAFVQVRDTLKQE